MVWKMKTPPEAIGFTEVSRATTRVDVLPGVGGVPADYLGTSCQLDINPITGQICNADEMLGYGRENECLNKEIPKPNFFVAFRQRGSVLILHQLFFNPNCCNILSRSSEEK